MSIIILVVAKQYFVLKYISIMQPLYTIQFKVLEMNYKYTIVDPYTEAMTPN
jgi:hypothetical protein